MMDSANVSPPDIATFTQQGEVSLRRMLDAQDDYQIMARWLSDERVLQFVYGRDNPFDIERVREKFGPRARAEDPVVPCFMMWSGRPIGYIQHYPVYDGSSYGLETVEGTHGADLFIGEPDLWGQGLGTDALSAMVRFLFASLKAERLVIDPRVTNQRAIRSYEKCGFEKIKVLPRHELHEGEYRDCWVMAIDRPGQG